MFTPSHPTRAASTPAKLDRGYTAVEGENIFFIANPGLSLWTDRSRFATGGKKNAE
ncbi:MAG: hypothetical protein ABSE87_03560 [Terracidiphilus sp.]